MVDVSGCTCLEVFGENPNCPIHSYDALENSIAELAAENERSQARNLEHEMRLEAEEAKSEYWKNRACAGAVKVKAARAALRELAATPMNLALEDWDRISNAILSALEPAAPEGRQEVAGCEWCVDGLQADGETPCPTCTRPAEQAVTEAMVEAGAKAIVACRFEDESEPVTDYDLELSRAALKAAMEAGR